MRKRSIVLTTTVVLCLSSVAMAHRKGQGPVQRRLRAAFTVDRAQSVRDSLAARDLARVSLLQVAVSKMISANKGTAGIESAQGLAPELLNPKGLRISPTPTKISALPLSLRKALVGKAAESTTIYDVKDKLSNALVGYMFVEALGQTDASDGVAANAIHEIRRHTVISKSSATPLVVFHSTQQIGAARPRIRAERSGRRLSGYPVLPALEMLSRQIDR
ncbi:MAG: hypothetical protein H6707_18095 [Deltaproteobacteria bacterium]|nr:hypothetical protein [Deltaproteobacteria bacterium]